MSPTKKNNNERIGRASSPKIVGSARNAFGTRLTHRVVCVRCEEVDHVSVRINDKKDSFCRNCAEILLATYDQGRTFNLKQVSRACDQCMRTFLIEESIAQKKERLLCNDCLRGFDVWRGKTTNNKITRVKTRTVLTKMGSKTTFRKKID